MKLGLRNSVLFLTVVAAIVVGSCKKKDPSILKVFVRTASNELVGNAKVVIIGDKYSNPPTREYDDTQITNSSGFAEFNLEQFFQEAHKDSTTGYFNIIAKKGELQGEGYIQCRAHITAVQTVNFK